MFLPGRALDGRENTHAHLDDTLPRLMREVGFELDLDPPRLITMFGQLSVYRGRRTASASPTTSRDAREE